MTLSIEHGTPLYTPALHFFEDEGISYAVDPEAPNWVALDSRGRELIDWLDSARGHVHLGDLVARYSQAHQIDAGKAWVHVHDFVRSLWRSGIVAGEPFDRSPYPGRSALSAPEGLRELWIQINNACNLSCTHCLVSSGPEERESHMAVLELASAPIAEVTLAVITGIRALLEAVPDDTQIASMRRKEMS